MDSFFCLALVFIITSVLVIPFFIHILVKTSQKSITPFTGTSSPERLSLLKAVFDLSEEDCHSLHFDGTHFHFGTRMYPYHEFSEIILHNYQRVTVTDERLPHRVTWRHTRMDGGPDGRYKYNWEILISYRNRLHFVSHGKHKTTLDTYGFGVEHSIEKMNRFLQISSQVNMEDYYQQYGELYREHIEHQKTIQNITMRIASLHKKMFGITYQTHDLTRMLSEDKLAEGGMVIYARLVQQLKIIRAADDTIKNKMNRIIHILQQRERISKQQDE